jgi:hypothetical protein
MNESMNEQNKMVWTCYKNECRQNPKGFEHETMMKMPKKKTKIKMGTRGGYLGTQRQMERFGC